MSKLIWPLAATIIAITCLFFQVTLSMQTFSNNVTAAQVQNFYITLIMQTTIPAIVSLLVVLWSVKRSASKRTKREIKE